MTLYTGPSVFCGTPHRGIRCFLQNLLLAVRNAESFIFAKFVSNLRFFGLLLIHKAIKM